MSVCVAALLAERLRQAAERVRELEEQAGRLLYGANDRQGYQALLLDKAVLLAGLPEALAGPLDALAGEGGAEVREAVQAIADDAAQALTIGSIFYMSALLYEPGHRPGDPNELERLVRRFEKGRQF